MTTFEKIAIAAGLYFVFGPSNKPEQESTIGKLNAYRFIPVFREKPSTDKNSRYNLGFTKNKSGVYLIKENGKIVYVGYSSYNLYKTITRHFQQWNHSNQEVITYANKKTRNNYTIRIVFVSPTRALKLEEALILKHRPRDNAQVLNLFEMSIKEAEKKEEQHDKILTEYNNENKFDYPPDWDIL